MKEYNPIKKLLLRELSENSRITVTQLAKKLKCSRNTVIKNMEQIDKDFGVRYTIEMDRKTLGFVRNQITTIRFAVKPNMKEIEVMFKDAKYLPLVLVTEGDFDVLIKQTGDQSPEYMDWALDLIKRMLPYRPSFKTSIVDNVTLGFVPLQSNIIDRLDFSAADLTALDKKILIILNDNSRASYVDIAKMLKIDVGTARYRLNRIIKSKLIKRFTIVMEKPPTSYNIAFFMNFDLAPGVFERARRSLQYYQSVDGTMPIMNSFQYVASLIGTYSNFSLASFENEEVAVRSTVLAFKDMFKEDNVSITYAKTVKVLRGSYPARNINIGKEMGPIMAMLEQIKKTKGDI